MQQVRRLSSRVSNSFLAPRTTPSERVLATCDDSHDARMSEDHASPRKCCPALRARPIPGETGPDRRFGNQIPGGVPVGSWPALVAP